MPIQYADVTYKPNGTPVAEQFDDVYYNDGDGLNETDYVFIQHNHLPQRWHTHAKPTFVIAETGFGTGLNCLRAIQHFAEFRTALPTEQCQHLHIISTEKYPLSPNDLRAALRCHPSLEPLAKQLLQQYPPAIEGCHRLFFNIKNTLITLDLWFGDILDTLPTLPMETDGLVDAWFLDGFAPSKNPQMWQPTLFEAMARLSYQGTTVATFTASGIVKRGLQASGFTIEKVPGFGRKREMLTAVFNPIQKQVKTNTSAPYYRRLPTAGAVGRKPQSIRIVGGGIAAASLALHAVRAGLKVELYCRDASLAQGASGNHTGGLYPQLTSDITHASLLQAHCFNYAMRFYQALATQQAFGFDACGVLLLNHSDTVATRQTQLVNKANWPANLVYQVTPEQATQIAGVPIQHSGLFVPHGGWVDPPSLVHAIITQAQSEGICDVVLNHGVDNEQILAWDNTDIPTVLALGHHSEQLQALAPLPYRLVRGQIEHVTATTESEKLQTVLCHKGYFTPAYKGFHALGSTYNKTRIDTEWLANEADMNWTTHQKAMGGHDWFDALKNDATGRAAVRCSTPDHQPLVGALPDITMQTDAYHDLYKALPLHKYPEAKNFNHTFLFTGLGSRGLTTAPLLSNLLISQITGAPLPFSQQLLDVLQPNRFLIRNLIRQQPYVC